MHVNDKKKDSYGFYAVAVIQLEKVRFSPRGDGVGGVGRWGFHEESWEIKSEKVKPSATITASAAGN